MPRCGDLGQLYQSGTVHSIVDQLGNALVPGFDRRCLLPNSHPLPRDASYQCPYTSVFTTDTACYWPKVEAEQLVVSSYESPAFRDLVSLWQDDGRTLRENASIAGWAGDALQKHHLLLTANFHAFLTDALAHAGLARQHLEQYCRYTEGLRARPARNDNFGISVHNRRRRLSASLVGLLTRTRIRSIWRGFVRWASEARGSQTLHKLVQQFLKAVRSRLGHRAHLLLVGHDKPSFRSARIRAFEYEFRVGNPPPVDAHAAVDQPVGSVHVASTIEVTCEQVFRLKDPTGPRNRIRPRRAKARWSSGPVAWRSVACSKRAA